jgi:hypothetical protein
MSLKVAPLLPKHRLERGVDRGEKERGEAASELDSMFTPELIIEVG